MFGHTPKTIAIADLPESESDYIRNKQERLRAR
jgi:hypothetical protein